MDTSRFGFTRRIRVRDSYVAIAKECFGKNYGSKVVSIAQIIELLMTCILYVVVCGDLLIGTFPEGAIDTRSWMMFTGIFLLPLGRCFNFKPTITYLNSRFLKIA